MAKYTKAEVEEARGMLVKFVRPGDTVYCILRSVARSGMSRRIDLYAVANNAPVFLSGYAATVMGWSHPPRNREGIRIDGCGMDMGFAMVSELARTMFGKSDALRHQWM